jgi:ankyrin repeat protein
MVQLLLERGATVNAFDKRDRRAIHWAAFMGHEEIVQSLIDFGAEVNCRDKEVILRCFSVFFFLVENT